MVEQKQTRRHSIANDWRTTVLKSLWELMEQLIQINRWVIKGWYHGLYMSAASHWYLE